MMMTLTKSWQLIKEQQPNFFFANQIAAEYDLGLGDAFASDGSFGYDHTKWVLRRLVLGNQ